MDETFLIHINCSSILFDPQQTQYTMFIDTTKISIVFELVEWIRWIFSVENCIYLTHDNSVIHELEDIRVLNKLKNLEIKPCGGPFCVHKQTYRTLLNNLQLFVNWNEVKVHKFFVEKLSQINGKLVKEKFGTNDNLESTEGKLNHSFIESENVENENRRICSEKSHDNLPNSSLSGYPFNSKKVFTDSSKSEPALVGESAETNCFDEKRNAGENLLIHFEGGAASCDNFFNVPNRSVALNTKSFANLSPVKSSKTNNKLETEDKTNKNFTKSKFNKKSHKFIRPFSLGEILSNIREDLEKQNAKNVFEKNNSSHISPEVGSFDETVTCDTFFEPNVIGGKKRQRTRKRKKPKKQDVENEHLLSPIIETNFNKSFNIFNSITNFKPNHIRFDEKEDRMEEDTPEDELGMKNEKEYLSDQKINDFGETFATTETNKLSDVCQNFSKETVFGSSDSKMENHGNGEKAVEIEDEISDLDGQVCSNNFQSFKANESFESNSFSQNLNMLQSLKEKMKSPVVVNRYY